MFEKVLRKFAAWVTPDYTLITTNVNESGESTLNITPKHGYAVTKSDVTTFAASMLRVGTGGNLVVDMAGGEVDHIINNVQDGEWLPIAVVKVKAATTASNITRYN